MEAAVAALEAAHASAGGDAVSAPLPDRLNGLWRLCYSSAFAAGGVGAPGAGTPIRLGAVLQRVQWRKAALDNIVELRVPAPLPLAPPLTVRATLAHALTPEGPRGCRIELTEVQLRLIGVKGARPLALPSPLRALGLDAALPAQLRGGAFDTPFCDGELRVSRGDGGELRVFVRE